MDPISAISFVSAIAGIVNLIAKGVLSLSELQSRYRIADLKVSLLIGQLSTLRAALTQIRYLVEDVSQAPRDGQLVDDLSISLSCLETIIGALDNRLSHLAQNAEDGLSNWAKVNFVWDEETMRDYLSLLDHQVNALGLVLSALQCRTTLEQSDMLRARESRHVLQLARDETSSMRWLTDSDSIAGSLQSAGTQDLETVHARFDFDSELFNSRAYQVASRANMIDALTGSRRKGVAHSTKIMSDPLGDTSGPNEASQIPRTGIALTTVVDVVSDAASGSLDVPALSQDAITEPQTSPTSLIETRESDVQLPDYVIHPPEKLGLLALQLGELPLSLVPNHRRQIRGGLFNVSTRLPLLFRPKKRVTAPFKVNNISIHKLVRVLILGISESGKTTLAKTMRAGHGDIDKAWLRLYRGTILNNTILSLKWLLFMAYRMMHDGALMWPLEKLWDEEAYFVNARVIWELEIDDLPKGSSSLATVASAAQYLWSHPYIRQVFKTSSTAQRPITSGKHLDLPLYLPDCAEYFLNSVKRILKTDYLPSLEDVLWAQTRTTGSWESKFVINGGTYQLFDVGGARSEHRKWITAFDDIDMIIFTIDLSCYHQALNEDIGINRMNEQFRLWESIANSDWFASARITVLFTKGDKLTPDRLRRHPFGAEYADFAGDSNSADDIIKYITWRLDGLLDRQANIASGRIAFCRSGTISESLNIWAKLMPRQ